jgi:hypothetical protein
VGGGCWDRQQLFGGLWCEPCRVWLASGIRHIPEAVQHPNIKDTLARPKAAYRILMNAPAQHMADTSPKPVPQILRGPQLACPPKNMGGCISTTIPTRLHRQPAAPNSPRGSPLHMKAAEAGPAMKKLCVGRVGVGRCKLDRLVRPSPQATTDFILSRCTAPLENKAVM